MAATAHTTHSITGDMARGAVAGTAGAWVMSKATRFLQALEDPESQRQEQNAMINGKSAPQIAAERISSRTGMEISAEQVHLAMGALPAAFYGVLIDRVPGMNKGN